MSTSAPLKFHGGKQYLASRLHAIAAPFQYDKKLRPDGWLHRVIPFAGGLGEFWTWDYQGVSEVINDVDRELTCFWRVLQHSSWFDEFQRRVQAIPFSQVEWEEADDNTPERTVVDRAINLFVRVRQSLAGRCESFAPLSRNRIRRGMNEQASAWLSAVEGLRAVHERLYQVVILCGDALDVIEEQDGPQTLFYLDPPYVRETRVCSNVYSHEMTNVQHEALLSLLGEVKGRFMLSGYDNDLYRAAERSHGWNRHEFNMAMNAAGGATKKRTTEIVWTNF